MIGTQGLTIDSGSELASLQVHVLKKVIIICIPTKHTENNTLVHNQIC